MKYIYLILILLLTSCATQQDRLHAKLSKGDVLHKTYIGHYKESTQKDNSGKRLQHKNLSKFKEVGQASWYGNKRNFHGKNTANGDKFNMNALTAAHKTLPIPSMIKVTNLKNNKSLILMVSDRGPYKKGRIVDVSSKAADLLGFKLQGITDVEIEYLSQETNKLLNKLALKTEHGKRPHGKIKEHKCSVNCHIKLANMKHGYKIE